MKTWPLTLIVSMALSAPAQPPVINNYAPPKEAAVLPSTSVDWDALPPKTTAVGQLRSVFDNPTRTLDKFEVHITTLNPGMASHPPHRHPWEEMLLVKDGDLEVSLNGRKHHAGPGALIFYASNDVHNATNVGTTPSTYYVINFVPASVHSASDKSAEEQALPGKLKSSIFDCNALATTPTPTGSRVVVVNSPTLTFSQLESHITTLNPGQHTAADMVDPGDEYVVLKSGTVEVTVNSIASRINAGSMLYWAPNDKRSLRNLGAGPATYQVIRVITDKSPKAAVPAQ
jgi:quercetin dioxygenase-like cupin family protein